MVGYHHILMIFIAIAIILLCMSLDPETIVMVGSLANLSDVQPFC